MDVSTITGLFLILMAGGWVLWVTHRYIRLAEGQSKFNLELVERLAFQLNAMVDKFINPPMVTDHPMKDFYQTGQEPSNPIDAPRPYNPSEPEIFYPESKSKGGSL